MCMGGRVAEELIFGEENITSGASSDIEQATRIARNMVTKFGFSDDVGIVYYGGETGQEHASAKTRSQIDAEVKKMTGASYERAKVSSPLWNIHVYRSSLNSHDYDGPCCFLTVSSQETLQGTQTSC